MKRWKRVLLIVLAVVLILGVAAFFIVRRIFQTPDIAAGSAAESAVVQTQQGKLRGSTTEYGYQYLGIPYAQALERFVPAQPVPAWDGVRDAVEVGPISPQSGMLGMSGGSQEGTDNNCQALNLWTPGVDGKKRPVMVWLHGGGFSTGSGNSEQYNGKYLSANGDVVVVSVNHRLGVSGFLDLSTYGEKYRYSGNVGVMDIQMALEWIRDNIAAFGGDPDNVTLFGQSGGGAKVLALMTSPYAKGLFHKGIVQSGATDTMGVTFTGLEASQYLTRRVLAQLNLTEQDIEQLQNVDIETLESASQKALQETAEQFRIPAPLTSGYAMEWGPVVDGDYLPTNPVTEYSFAQSGADIPLLIGSNLNEWSGFTGGRSSSQALTEAFQAAYPDKDAKRAARVDSLIRLPMLKIMSHKVRQGGAPVYAYVFTWDEGMGGAYHGAEIPFVFDRPQNDETRQKLADQISMAWANFARNGVPSADGLPDWEAYTLEDGATMLLDTQSKLVYHHDKALMALLNPDYKYE